MFNKIKLFFNKNKKEDTKNTVCSISISLKHDSSIETALFWPEWNDSIGDKSIDKIASEYAVMLHLISSGNFKEEIMSTLEIAKEINQSDQDQKFLKKINHNLQTLNQFNKNSFKNILSKNSPMILPTSVFKNSKHE
jgi:hypothetical protein